MMKMAGYVNICLLCVIYASLKQATPHGITVYFAAEYMGHARRRLATASASLDRLTPLTTA